MTFKDASRNWRTFHADDFRIAFTSPDRKSFGRQMVEATTLFWRYRYPPLQYIKNGLYLANAPSAWKDHLPRKVVRDLQLKLNPRHARILADDKRLFRERMEAAGLPAIREAFTVDAAGEIRDANGEKLALEQAAERLRGGEFFAKPIDGTLGEGAQLVRPGDDPDAFVANARNVIVQPRIRQHPRVQELYPHAVNTVRIDTLRDGDGWIHNAAVLKVGVGGGIVDNSAGGGITIGIDLDTGALYPTGRQKPKFSTNVYERHPDTGVAFRDFIVPHWDVLCETVVRAAEAMLPLQTLGWDVAITEESVLLVEANRNWDPTLSQIGWGGLAETTVGRMACNLRGLKSAKHID